MNNFDLKKYLAENKLLKENINLEAALDKFESLEDEFSYNPSFDGIQEIGNFIDFLRERHPNGVGYEVDLDAEFAHQTMKNMHAIWKRPISLSTTYEEKEVIFKFDGKVFSANS